MALAAGGVSVATAGTASRAALAVAILGWFAIAAATWWARPSVAGVGLGGLWMATVLAALDGLSTAGVVVSLVAAVLAWDAVQRATVLGRQLRGAAPTGRIEAVHAAPTVVVGLSSASVAGVVAAVGPPQGSTAAIVGLAVGTALLVAALRDG